MVLENWSCYMGVGRYRIVGGIGVCRDKLGLVFDRIDMSSTQVGIRGTCFCSELEGVVEEELRARLK